MLIYKTHNSPIRHAIGVIAVAGLLAVFNMSVFSDEHYKDWMVAVGVSSTQAPSDHSFDTGKRSTFQISCLQGNMSISVNWYSSLDWQNLPSSIEIWFDEQLVEFSDWVHNTDNDASYYQGNSWKLVERLMNTQRLIINFGKGFHDQEISATFNLFGLDKAAETVESFCSSQK